MNEPVHIHLKEGKTQSENKNSHSEIFIIETNKHLVQTNNTLRKTINVLTHERDEFEEQVDRAETSTQYMRGLLKNLVAINKGYENVDRLYRKETSFLENMLKKYKFHLYIVIIMQILEFISLFLFSKYVFLFFWFVNLGILANCIKNNMKSTNKQKIRNEKLEIKKIHDACDFLHNYIDNL